MITPCRQLLVRRLGFLRHGFSDAYLHMEAEPSSPTAGSSTQTPTRVSLIRSMLSMFSFEGSIPRFRSRPSRKDTSEGLIAPRSPNILRTHPTQNNVTLSSSLRPMAYPPPPRSPGPRVQELEVPNQPTNNPNFSLQDIPPRRRPQPVRQSTGESTGLGISGLRRTASFMAEDN